MRLTTNIREAVTSDMINHAFGKRAKEIALRAAKHASAVYHDIYTKSQCEDISRCAPGMLPVVHKVQCQFGTSFTDVHFDGHTSLKHLFYKMPSHNLPVWYKHMSGCVKNYQATHPLAIEYGNLENERKDLRRDIEAAHKAITVALNQTTSSSTLVELWPEVAPFLVPYEKVERQVPVIQSAALNEVLGLPV